MRWWPPFALSSSISSFLPRYSQAAWSGFVPEVPDAPKRLRLPQTARRQAQPSRFPTHWDAEVRPTLKTLFRSKRMLSQRAQPSFSTLSLRRVDT